MTFQQKYVKNKATMEHRLKYGDPVSIRFNQEETDILNDFCDKADIKSNMTGAKWLMMYGYNVIHGHSTSELLSELFKKERARR